ncbi:hypothetical protein ANCDUO_21910, partial [Ancylostoma duodenale]
VTIDDIDVCDLNVHSLRDQIGVVSQEPVLFDGTLYENIKMGNETATMDQVIEACRLVSRLFPLLAEQQTCCCDF